MYSTPNTNTNTNTNTNIITSPPKTTIVNTTPYPPNYYKTSHVATTSGTSRDYRKGNWTLEETLILIKAKKLENERRANNNSRGGELRWKWIENYCWNNGCIRNQNQCNDKWDNLLRDYKKVREFVTTYWSMDKNERKYRNLPSNMLLEIYQELNEVIEKKNVIIHSHHHQQQQQQLPPLEVLAPPLPTSTLPDISAESSETQGEEEGEKVDMETKKRRVRDITSSILHSNTLLSQTLKHYDEKREKRHRELMELEQQRLHLEETRNEVNRQGIAGLVASIKKLSDAIHALISEKHT